MTDYTLKFETLDQVRHLMSLTGGDVKAALEAYRTCQELGIPENHQAMFAARRDIRMGVGLNMAIAEVYYQMHLNNGCGDEKCNSVSFLKTHQRLRTKCQSLITSLDTTDATCGEPIEEPMVTFLGFDTAPESADVGGYL